MGGGHEEATVVISGADIESAAAGQPKVYHNPTLLLSSGAQKGGSALRCGWHSAMTCGYIV